MFTCLEIWFLFWPLWSALVAGFSPNLLGFRCEWSITVVCLSIAITFLLACYCMLGSLFAILTIVMLFAITFCVLGLVVVVPPFFSGLVVNFKVKSGQYYGYVTTYNSVSSTGFLRHTRYSGVSLAYIVNLLSLSVVGMVGHKFGLGLETFKPVYTVFMSFIPESKPSTPVVQLLIYPQPFLIPHEFASTYLGYFDRFWFKPQSQQLEDIAMFHGLKEYGTIDLLLNPACVPDVDLLNRINYPQNIKEHDYSTIFGKVRRYDDLSFLQKAVMERHIGK